MPFLERANQIIPGYALLTPAERAVFEATPPGIAFVNGINAEQSVFQWVKRTFFESHESYLETIQEARRPLLMEDSYENLIIQITQAVLAHAYPDFNLLNAVQKTQLASAHCARMLFPDMPYLIIEMPHLIGEWPNRVIVDQDQYDRNIDQMNVLMREFEEGLATDVDMTEIREHIVREKLRIQAQAKQNATNKLFHRYVPAPGIETESILEEEYNQLTRFIAAILQAHASNEMGLHAFNQKQAQTIADDILTAFENNQVLQVNQWLTPYQQSLQTYMTDSLGTIPGVLQPFPTNASFHQITRDFLSSVYTNNVAKGTQDAFFTLLDEMADAHAFIQATGFSTQNETSYLSWVDVYNYTRSRLYIKDAKNDLYRFLNPFRPLFAEWRNISQYETNTARQIIRTLIPLLILVGVVIFVAAILSPIVISEAAALLILIPTLYVGALMATAYVLTKDRLYHQLRQAYYGGAYAIPEYQVNARMQAGFSNPNTASEVRDVYIEEIKQCRAIEADFQQRPQGTLTQSDMTCRKENAGRYDELNLEWYDIHSNISVGCDRIKNIALERIQKDGRAACIQSAMNDPVGVQTWTNEVITGIRSTLNRLENGGEEPIVLPNRHQFFTPVWFEPQAKAERLHALKEAIDTNAI